MNHREAIFQRIRECLEALPSRTPYPEWDDELVVCRNHPRFEEIWDLFSYRLAQVNGTPLVGPDAIGTLLHEHGATLGYCDPALARALEGIESLEGIILETEYDRARYDDYAFGITAARGAIAESGTIILNDTGTSTRLGALSPWIHVAVLREEHLWADIPTASAEVMDHDPSIIFATGPSKTADIEGILIEGVHGPGVQACCLWNY